MPVLKTDVKRLCSSPALYAGILLLITAGIISSFSFVSYVRASAEYDQNATFLLVFQSILYSDLFSAVLPIVCPLSYAAAFLEEVQSRFIIYSIFRCSYRQYFISKLITVALSGGITACVSLLSVFFYSMLAAGYTNVPGIWNILINSLIPFIAGGCLFSVIGGLSAAMMKNKYMAYTVPFIFYYILTIFQRRYYKPLYFLNPKEWITARYLPRTSGIIILLFLLLLTGIWYLFSMRKKVRNV